MKENIVKNKSYAFAIRIINLYKDLTLKRKEYILSKQLLRSGTSIGANIEESVGAQSRSDFLSKLSISYKEARETSYWLRLLKDTGYLTKIEFNSINGDCEEILRILGKIQKSTILIRNS